MTSRFIPSSSWIATLAYVPYSKAIKPPVEGTTGFLLVTSREGRTYAYAVPPWVVGLLMAAQGRGESVGRTYNRLVRGQWPSVKVGEA